MLSYKHSRTHSLWWGVRATSFGGGKSPVLRHYVSQKHHSSQQRQWRKKSYRKKPCNHGETTKRGRGPNGGEPGSIVAPRGQAACAQLSLTSHNLSSHAQDADKRLNFSMSGTLGNTFLAPRKSLLVSRSLPHSNLSRVPTARTTLSCDWPLPIRSQEKPRPGLPPYPPSPETALRW